MKRLIPATILLIDDHPMLRRGVKQLIHFVDDFEVVGEAGNSEQGVELAMTLKPDIILLDLNMPDVNGLYTLGRLKQCQLASRVVVFSVSDHEHDVITALKKGASGYLLKDMEPEDFVQALQQVIQNKLVLSPGLIPILAKSVQQSRPIGERSIEQLTQREQDILTFIAQGLANKLIARQLNITESTVKVHVKSILRKLNFKSRIEVAIWFLQQQ